jgi:hypothetical protein
MMEFTYGGLVRQGFGFYNPNHAAALICAVLPLLWAAWFRWRGWKARVPVLAGHLLLLAALAATFSRTGLVVLAGELLLYLLLRRGKGWRSLLGVGVVAAAAAAGFGVLSRFAVDASLVNRFDIWRAGLALFAANPWRGVGLGNSGTLATAFLLPEGIECRTLVNSHLTLLAECGAVAGFFWLLAQAAALANGRRRPAACASLAGVTVSAFCGSVFDWPALFDFRGFGGLPALNFVLSWALFVLFLGLTLSLVCAGMGRRASGSGDVRGWGVAAAGCVSVLLALRGLVAPGPAVEDGFVVHRTEGQAPALVLYGDDWTLKRVTSFLPETGYRVPVRPWEGEAPCAPASGRVLLFGECASYASEYPAADVVLVAPPDYFTLPANVSTIWLRVFGDHGALLEQAEKLGIRVAFF